MPEFTGMPLWAWIMIATVAAALAIGVVLWFTLGRRVLTRRYLVALVGRRESVRASKRTLEAVLRHLADESDEALAEFAEDSRSVDRRALVEVRDQMRVLADELDTRPMPGRLIQVAEELADAAFVIAEQSGRFPGNMEADEVLAALSKMDLARVRTQVEEADRWIDEACVEYEIEDTAVYGGGLYI